MDIKKIGIICGRRISNAVIIQNLEEEGFELHIVKYQIPITHWYSWIKKRISETGVLVLLGHVSLSMYLRCCRLFEYIRGRSIWDEEEISHASWKSVKSNLIFSHSENDVIEQVKDVDIIILLDHFRFSHRFFRKLKMPIVEIIYGITPEYMGDSASWWAMCIGDKRSVGYSIIERMAQYNKFSILESDVVDIHNTDIRKIKVKQVKKISKILPKIIKNYSKKDHQLVYKANRRIFIAPTLCTYLRSLINGKISKLPSYSYKDDVCYIIK